jgi:hypothetical protein
MSARGCAVPVQTGAQKTPKRRTEERRSKKTKDPLLQNQTRKDGTPFGERQSQISSASRRCSTRPPEGESGRWIRRPLYGVLSIAGSSRSPFSDPKHPAESLPMRQSRLWTLW